MTSITMLARISNQLKASCQLASSPPFVVTRGFMLTVVAKGEKRKRYNLSGVDLMKDSEQTDRLEAQKCLFPILRDLGVTTEDKIHRFSIQSNSVVKYIKLGIINRNLAVQYCHYLNELARSGESGDAEYYTERSTMLTEFILKQNRDLSAGIKLELLLDLASTSKTACALIGRQTLDEQELWPSMNSSMFTKLLVACYKFKLWDVASYILKQCQPTTFSWTAFDDLSRGMDSTLNQDQNQMNEKEKEKIKRDLLDHLKELIAYTRKQRIQFVTKTPELFVQNFEILMPYVIKRPIIKGSGRCTHCNSHLPLYDNQNVPKLNDAIKRVLDHRNEVSDVTIHSTKRDLENFYQFLDRIHKLDGKPLDCVIDGLNVAYNNNQPIYKTFNHADNFQKTVRVHENNSLSQVLINAIIRSNFLDKFRKILVIGKNHMRRWPNLMDFFAKNKIHFYASDNTATDDLFQLYAATLSPKTVLVTNDFLRDHLSLVDSDVRIELQRWIDTHQVWIDSRTLTPIMPTPFEKLPHYDESSGNYHIPIIDYNKLNLIAQHQPPPHLNSQIMMWICCSATKRIDHNRRFEKGSSEESGNDNLWKKTKEESEKADLEFTGAN